MRRRVLISAALAACIALPIGAAAQQVRLTLADGRATLHATDAPPAAILAEWARLGGTRIVDAERLTGAPLTLTLENVPEREALDIVLRSAAGYIAAARPPGATGASSFDRIIVMPVSANASTARSGPAPAMAVAVQPIEPMVEADGQAVETPMMAGDGTAGADGADGGEQPASSTDFDYANPQRYFAARAAQQRAAAEAAAQGGSVGADATVDTTTGPGGLSMGTLLSAPGTIPTPPPAAGNGASGQPSAFPSASPSASPRVNPYGLPADAAPGTSTGPPMEPDRSKYINPYAPTPRPPGQ